MIDRDSPLALYEQLKRIFAHEIATGKLRPGDRLPADREICSRFDVSRITVVRALTDLARDGLIERIQGKGSIVAQPRVTRAFDELIGFTEALRRQGLATHAQMLSRDLLEDAPIDGAEGERFVRIRRLRYINDTPAVITTSYLSEPLAEAMSAYDLEQVSFFDTFERILGRPVTRADRSVTPVIATEEAVELLGVPPGSAHFFFRGNTYVEGVVIEATESLFRGDLFEVRATVSRVREHLA